MDVRRRSTVRFRKRSPQVKGLFRMPAYDHFLGLCPGVRVLVPGGVGCAGSGRGESAGRVARRGAGSTGGALAEPALEGCQSARLGNLRLSLAGSRGPARVTGSIVPAARHPWRRDAPAAVLARDGKVKKAFSVALATGPVSGQPPLGLDAGRYSWRTGPPVGEARAGGCCPAAGLLLAWERGQERDF